MSTPSYRDRTPGYDLHGRRHAYRSSSFRSATFTLRKPLPTGVVIGPLIATRVSRIDASTGSGSGVPYRSTTSAPASWTSQSNSTPVASSTRRVASESSGPTPSPGINVTRWLMTSLPVRFRPIVSIRAALVPDHLVPGGARPGPPGADHRGEAPAVR